mmetsp:Transcript_99656/g.160693  ORF Transcript_99656/g.160693 Transcript_99656/m.160693 type:complete len:273 (-) Transcript_99656:224-1042(-)
MLAHDCHLVLNVRRIDAVPCIGAILFVRQHPAVGLAVHGLGSEGGGKHDDGLALELLERRGQLHYFHSDERVLLGAHALARRAVVVGADLVVARRKHRIPLPKVDFFEFLEFVKLPLDECVVVAVDVRRDEGPAPVNLDTHINQIGFGKRREKLEPVYRIHELGHYVSFNVHRFQDLPLIALALFGGRFRLFGDKFSRVLYHLLLLHLSGSSSIESSLLLLLGCVQLSVHANDVTPEIVRSSLDGHAGAVETKRPESLLSFETLISHREFRL